MTTHTAQTTTPAAPQSPDALPRLVLLEQTAAPSKADDDWRLSRSAKPLRTWRLSK
ncbi:hypothetical protein [Pseudomonas sp. GV071]|uniref:hypothetical protein n=1 Tax=Pseudomonas sp. GV071 TaxID=2135754 RepID=UPI0012E7F0F4|nr:hypothetical protein [Pseudomonas sp. GV071]